jgi:hypothetical protein
VWRRREMLLEDEGRKYACNYFLMCYIMQHDESSIVTKPSLMRNEIRWILEDPPHTATAPSERN